MVSTVNESHSSTMIQLIVGGWVTCSVTGTLFCFLVATGYPQSKASWPGSCTARMPQECCTGVIALTLKLPKLIYCCSCSFPSRADLKQHRDYARASVQIACACTWAMVELPETMGPLLTKIRNLHFMIFTLILLFFPLLIWRMFHLLIFYFMSLHMIQVTSRFLNFFLL
jgi:hypothetical protein